MSSYVNELTSWVKKKRNVSRRDKNVVMFLAIKKDLMEAMEAGYTLRTIWLHMVETKRLEVSYDSFLNYVARHIRAEGAAPASKAKGKVTSTPPAAEMPGFKWNPIPNKKDLI